MSKGKNKFDYIISLGFSCHVAESLDSMFYRDHSYPFDWVISDMKTINDLIENNYFDLFNIRYLYRNSSDDNIIKHKKYSIDFYHDFSGSIELSAQVQKVREKYFRRIKHFNNVRKSKKRILFIRYLKNKQDSGDEMIEIERFINIMKKDTTSFRMLLISNNNGGWVSQPHEYVLHHFIVKPNSEYLFDPPLSDKKIYEFFRSSIHYNRYHFLSNLLFQLRVQIPRNAVKLWKKINRTSGIYYA